MDDQTRVWEEPDSNTLAVFERADFADHDTLGFLLKAGRDLVLLTNLDKNLLMPDGYLILRREDVLQVEADQTFIAKHVRANGFGPKPQPFVGLMNWQQALSDIKESGALVVIEREIEEPDICLIGRILEVREEEVILD